MDDAEVDFVLAANEKGEAEDNEDEDHAEGVRDEDDDDDGSVKEDFSSPLIAAARIGDFVTVQRLLQQGADKDETTSMGRTSMWYAAAYNQLSVMSYLAEQGANLEKTDGLGWSPLMTASYEGHIEAVRHLLEQGADRDRNVSGLTSLHWAALNGHLETAKLLMVYGADLNAKCNSGLLPIDCAHTEEMKQAIRDEPRRRMDHGHKRATEQDRHHNVTTSASTQQEEGDEDEDGQCHKKPRLDAEAEKGNVAEEDEDSEPSSNEEDD